MQIIIGGTVATGALVPPCDVPVKVDGFWVIIIDAAPVRTPTEPGPGSGTVEVPPRVPPLILIAPFVIEPLGV